jgi:uncharacterized membrane protein required for colicin V production
MIDYACFGIAALSGFIGWKRGLIKESFGIISIIGAVLITFFGWPYITRIAYPFINSLPIARLSSIGGLFVISLTILSAITHKLSDFIKETPFILIDRFGGLIYGIIRSILIGSSIIFGYSKYFGEFPNTPTCKWLSNLSNKATQVIVDLSQSRQFKSHLQNYKEIIEEQIPALKKPMDDYMEDYIAPSINIDEAFEDSSDN